MYLFRCDGGRQLSGGFPHRFYFQEDFMGIVRKCQNSEDRLFVELESATFRALEKDCVAMRYGFFYEPGTWCTPIQSDSAREFLVQRIDFVLQPLGTIDFYQFLGFVQFFSQFGKPAPIGMFRLIVDQFASITQSSDMNSAFCRSSPPRGRRSASPSPLLSEMACGKVQDMELRFRIAQKMSEIRQALGVP
jgi:hypothetical protein